MATPNILTPIGFDGSPAPNQSLSAPNPDTLPSQVPLQLLHSATQFLQQGLEADTQSSAVTAKAKADLVAATSRSSEQISQISSMVAQTSAQAAQRQANSFGDLAGTIGGLIQQDKQQQLAKLKQQYDVNKAAASKDLLDLQVNWIDGGKLASEGTQPYRDAIASTISKYQLPPEDITALTTSAYAPAVDQAKKHEGDRIKYAEDIATQNRRVGGQVLLNSLSASLGNLASTAYLPQEVQNNAQEEVSTKINDYLNNKDIPLLDRLTNTATALEQYTNAATKRSSLNSEMQSKLAGTIEVIGFAQPLALQVTQGTLGRNEYESLVLAKAQSLGIVYNVQDPTANQATINTILKQQNDLEELKRLQFQNYEENSAIDTHQISSVAQQVALDPTVAAFLENSKITNANTKAGLQLGKDFVRFKETDYPNANKRLGQLRTDMLELNSSATKWLINAVNRGQPDSNASVQQTLESQALGDIVKAIQGNTATPEQIAQYKQSVAEIIRAKQAEQQQVIADIQAKQARFNQAGLTLDPKQLQKNYEQGLVRRQEYEQQRQKIRSQNLSLPQNRPLGQNPNFNGGEPTNAPTVSLPRLKYGASNIVMPFSMQDATRMAQPGGGQIFGADRPGRKHNGVDFGVPVGTKTYALVYGTVLAPFNDPKGYGTNVKILGDDGKLYVYGHLSRSQATPGQRVAPGMQIALTGNTGSGSGPHLHLGIYDYSNKDTSKPLDPGQYLASQEIGRPAKGVRTANTGNIPINLPPEAIPVGNNYYLLHGKLINARKPDVQKPAPYTAAQPLRTSKESNYNRGNMTNSPDDHYNYAVLKQNPELRAALARTADQVGIPGQWIADIIGHETAGTFSSSIESYDGRGFTGLIQFGDLAMKDLGVTRQQLKSMTPAQQMPYVANYIKLQMKYAGVDKIKTIEELAATVQQGHVALRALREKGSSAAKSFNKTSVSLSTYINKLGKNAGRSYQTDNRQSSLTTPIHTSSSDGCPLCASIDAQNSAFIPHEGIENA